MSPSITRHQIGVGDKRGAEYNRIRLIVCKRLGRCPVIETAVDNQCPLVGFTNQGRYLSAGFHKVVEPGFRVEYMQVGKIILIQLLRQQREIVTWIRVADIPYGAGR